jgi:hypothetical protein
MEKAEGDYNVAKQQCEAMSGDAQKTCKDQASARYDAAKTAAMQTGIGVIQGNLLGRRTGTLNRHVNLGAGSGVLPRQVTVHRQNNPFAVDTAGREPTDLIGGAQPVGARWIGPFAKRCRRSRSKSGEREDPPQEVGSVRGFPLRHSSPA